MTEINQILKNNKLLWRYNCADNIVYGMPKKETVAERRLVERIMHKTLKGKSYDNKRILETIIECHNKHKLIMEKMISTGHYKKYKILKDMIIVMCKTKELIVSTSSKKQKVLDNMFNALRQNDSLIQQGVPFKKIYRKFLREYNATRKEQIAQAAESETQNSAVLSENIDKLLHEQNAVAESDQESNRPEGRWISLFSRLFSTLRAATAKRIELFKAAKAKKKEGQSVGPGQ